MGPVASSRAVEPGLPVGAPAGLAAPSTWQLLTAVARTPHAANAASLLLARFRLTWSAFCRRHAGQQYLACQRRDKHAASTYLLYTRVRYQSMRCRRRG